MITERNELKGRILRAKAAVDNPPYGSDLEGINLLSTQVCCMEQYLDILERRIEHEKTK